MDCALERILNLKEITDDRCNRRRVFDKLAANPAIMNNPFKSIPLYLKLWMNKMEITNLNTGESVTRMATVPFSNPRFVVADWNAARELLMITLKEMGLSRKFLPAAYHIAIQQMVDLEGGLSAIEIRALRDLGENIGGRRIAVIEHSQPLSNEAALSTLIQK